MNRFIIFYCLLIPSLFGCQHLPLTSLQPSTKVKANTKLEHLLKFGADFAVEFNDNPEKACAKFISLHQNGDWRASWVLALTANKDKSERCLNSEDAIQILTTLEARNKIYPEVVWLNQFHLQLLSKIQEKTEKVTQLHDSLDKSEKHTKNNREQLISDLKKENKDLRKKLEALKNLETSISIE